MSVWYVRLTWEMDLKYVYGGLSWLYWEGKTYPLPAAPFPRRGPGAESMSILFSLMTGHNVTSYPRLLAAWLLCHDWWYFDMWTKFSLFSLKLLLSEHLITASWDAYCEYGINHLQAMCIVCEIFNALLRPDFYPQDSDSEMEITYAPKYVK